jgi:hypothetical protein
MNGHVPTRTLRAKLVSPARRVNKVVSSESENEDDDDYDDDQYWPVRGHKHMRISNGGRGKGKK